MPDPLHWLHDALADLEQRGLRRRLIARSGAQQADRLQFADRTYLNFGSNDYLGLAAGDLLPAVRASLDEVGWGAGASPLVTGRGALHAELERALAEFEGTEAALLFPTGFAANMATIAALVSEGDELFSDAKNHASIIDGARLSGARVRVYRHCDVDHLGELLRASHARRKLIVTDGLFSMDGDLAPLDRLVEVAAEHAAMLLVDEAHATGVFGKLGRGVCEHYGVDAGVPIRVGTLSKALGSQGGFVVGSQALIDWLTNRARAYVFSTAAPEALAAAGIAALQIVRDEPQRRAQLLTRSEQLRSALLAQGFSVGGSASQIIPLMVGDPERTMQASLALRELGLWVPGIRPPSVPAGESLLRISLSYAHSPAMLEQLLAGLREVLT
ncbi:MAG TPA: 8-amino-7-oxononanoate synthase [Pirellulaceae bacterium]|nr:8-amino-7-oxononanoate synthase [Pirellulaceae bacterium]